MDQPFVEILMSLHQRLFYNLQVRQVGDIKFHLMLDPQEYYHTEVLNKINLKSKLFNTNQWKQILNSRRQGFQRQWQQQKKRQRKSGR